ncbi:MAG: hypothetical protein H6696_07075 [Deferribacteres bacterium]|nr:hypothetical protein [Deferribacteres bacterium]
MFKPAQNPDWPTEALEFIDKSDYQSALGFALQKMQTDPADSQFYEIASFLLTNVWLFRSAAEFARRGLEQNSLQSFYLQEIQQRLASDLIPLHEGLPVITSDEICFHWLSENADGKYTSEQTLVFAENLEHLLAYFDGKIPYDQLPEDMQLIIKKAYFLDNQWDFSQSRVLVDLGGFDGMLVWTLSKLHPNIEKIFVIDTVYPEAAPEFYEHHGIPIEYIQSDLLDLNFEELPGVDTFLMIDVAEHIPHTTFRQILDKGLQTHPDSCFYVYTPSLNHNNLERFRPEIPALPLQNFDFWIWTGAALSPLNISHVPSHVSYKSTGWLLHAFNQHSFNCNAAVHLNNAKMMKGRLYLTAQRGAGKNEWNARGLQKGVMEFQL